MLIVEDVCKLRPDLETFVDQGDNPADEIIVLPETNTSVTIKWDFFGLHVSRWASIPGRVVWFY